jgi:hypothetical protein
MKSSAELNVFEQDARHGFLFFVLILFVQVELRVFCLERVLVVSLGPTSLESMVFGSIDLSLSLFVNFLFRPEVTFEFDNVFVIV